MKNKITCSNYKCKHYWSGNKCGLKIVAINDNGCASFILSEYYNPNVRIKKVCDEISEHTNRC